MAHRRRRRTRHPLAVLAAALAVVAVVPVVPVPAGPTAAATAPPDVFSVRLEGTTVRHSVGAVATTLNPASGYTFAKIDSTPALGGGRTLQMKAVGAYGDPGDLGGAVLFDPTVNPATDGAQNFPTYAQAFHPAFGSQTPHAQKCAANPLGQPSDVCAAQPGPYAEALVEPEDAAPRALGVGRGGGGEGAEETLSTAEIVPLDDGTIVGRQVNEGRDHRVPGTPVTVRSFLARTEIEATPEKVVAKGECSADISVGGEPITSADDLAAALEPFSTVTGVKVTYLPPTTIKRRQLPAGGLAVSCLGARFLVERPEQGVASQY
ncbi:MAG: hypothetical protein ACRDJP_05150, partial [Actinomycetota bacterium]